MSRRRDEYVDLIAVERRCAGEHAVPLTQAEAAEAFARLEVKGLSASEMAARLGVSERAVVRWRAGARPKSLPGHAA
jgi:DNA-directed RNA polymerase specialized sigma24 family protein